MRKTNVAILASGSGSTTEAFIRDVEAQHYPLNVKIVICNNPKAFVFERVRNLNTELGLEIASVTISAKTQETKHPVVHGQQTLEEQAAIITRLQEDNIDLVLLLGYMKRIGPLLLDAYGWLPTYESPYQARMLNTHPGILPQTVGTHGLGTQEFTLAQGMREGGQTLHVVSSEYDRGPIIAEHRVTVEAGDTPETLFDRIQAEEKRHIAADVLAFVEKQQQYWTANT